MPKSKMGAARRRIVYEPVTFSEEDGVRYLHFGTEWVQGAMRLEDPDAIELEYAQQMMLGMLFLEAPGHIVQLGLGAAALTKFCYRFFRRAQVSAVELNPAVITAARAMFRLPPDDDRLAVVAADAETYLASGAVREVDLMQIDLYDASARGPVLDSVDFYRLCRSTLNDAGAVVTVNLFGDHPSYARNARHLAAAFAGRVLILPEVHEGNRVAVAFHGPALEVTFARLYDRARQLVAATGMPARAWVNALKVAGGARAAGGRLRI